MIAFWSPEYETDGVTIIELFNELVENVSAGFVTVVFPEYWLTSQYELIILWDVK